MTSLSNFAKNFKPKNNDQKQENTADNLNERVEKLKRENLTKQNQDVMEDSVRENFEKYSQLSPEELNSQLFKEAARLKQNGTFNFDALQSGLESMSAYISPEQKIAMQNLLNKLK